MTTPTSPHMASWRNTILYQDGYADITLADQIWSDWTNAAELGVYYRATWFVDQTRKTLRRTGYLVSEKTIYDRVIASLKHYSENENSDLAKRGRAYGWQKVEDTAE